MNNSKKLIEEFNKLSDRVKEEYDNSDLLDDDKKADVLKRLHSTSTMLVKLDKYKNSSGCSGIEQISLLSF